MGVERLRVLNRIEMIQVGGFDNSRIFLILIRFVIFYRVQLEFIIVIPN